MAEGHRCQALKHTDVRQAHPEVLTLTATYLFDGVEGAHPLGAAVGQPVGDLAATY